VTIERVITSGFFSLDGCDVEVENNVWIVGGEEVIIIDAAHDHRRIVDAVGTRTVTGIIATHGHNDHIDAAVALSEAVDAPVFLHPADSMLWHQVYPDRYPDGELVDEMLIHAGERALRVLHTPGHSPGSCCLYDEGAQVLFSGDTLFEGGPGATGQRYSDYPTLVASIRDRLLALPAETRVLPGHGAETTIGREARGLPDWEAKL
jgi:glyoxylase-like metal-dependent hydrolase (beta-lactamase superfamily II)